MENRSKLIRDALKAAKDLGRLQTNLEEQYGKNKIPPEIKAIVKTESELMKQRFTGRLASSSIYEGFINFYSKLKEVLGDKPLQPLYYNAIEDYYQLTIQSEGYDPVRGADELDEWIKERKLYFPDSGY
ncbi:hypothetical protein MKQ70_32120 [Chitinophaga sedimenti]|uniref:hypothetical protein n=1 Tax=Chitinophaga sedimenti TaxID=2033606 RepID=UPI002003B1D8|nr:hypothetical protein [Chitinophaga sedimenti]MCK7559365.1 hypothetical protein [Chitinophaga sedimenti]